MSVLAVTNGVRRWIETPPDLTIRYPFAGQAFVSQVFGQISITGSIHLGVDLVVAQVPALAVASGRVRSTFPYGRDVPGLGSDGSPGGYGSTVLVDHVTPAGFRFLSYECHLLRVDVRAGDWVTAGQQLGITDTTGISTGNHMHFELRLDDVWVTRFDPAPFFNRVIITPPDPEDLFAMLTPAGKLAAEAVFNDPGQVHNLSYALALCEELERAKPGATPGLVGASLVTLGAKGRLAVATLGNAFAEIHRLDLPGGGTDQKIVDALTLMYLRQARQFIAANVPLPGAGETPEPPAPAKPPKA